MHTARTEEAEFLYDVKYVHIEHGKNLRPVSAGSSDNNATNWLKVVRVPFSEKLWYRAIAMCWVQCKVSSKWMGEKG